MEKMVQSCVSMAHVCCLMPDRLAFILLLPPNSLSFYLSIFLPLCLSLYPLLIP